MRKIPFYEDTYFMFSNFSAHAFTYKGLLYPTAEHAYQAAKFDDESVREAIRNARSPIETKELANITHKDKRKKKWHDIKIEVMHEIVSEKVMQHKEVRDALVNTGEDEIVENSPTDYFWGCGKDGSGENQMGKILMKIRAELRV